MTRINVVPVETLTDKHLMAEYREMTRPFNKVIARIEKGTTGSIKIPPRYCLNTGHETFFFDKLKWLWIRYGQVCDELIGRRFNINLRRFCDISNHFRDVLGHTEFWNDYQPTPEDMYLNMARLAKRSKLDTVIEELL